MSDNQQRAAEVLGFRELEMAQRFARDDLHRITAALDAAEARGRTEAVEESRQFCARSGGCIS